MLKTISAARLAVSVLCRSRNGSQLRQDSASAGYKSAQVKPSVLNAKQAKPNALNANARWVAITASSHHRSIRR